MGYDLINQPYWFCVENKFTAVMIAKARNDFGNQIGDTAGVGQNTDHLAFINSNAKFFQSSRALSNENTRIAIANIKKITAGKTKSGPEDMT
jgi:hypothetical protein